MKSYKFVLKTRKWTEKELENKVSDAREDK
jgi:hypothetical protein